MPDRKGDKALGDVRARYRLGDSSDIGRIGRQQEFMQSLANRAVMAPLTIQLRDMSWRYRG
jgi:anionic cell wall polymer biosynthesis LytR-Cps2A-Psr (LCP) family protein